MKMYYAKSVDGRKTLQFRGETLIANDPFIFEYIVKLTNEKAKNYTIKGKPATIDMKDYQIMEIEMEVKDEGKQHNCDNAHKEL